MFEKSKKSEKSLSDGFFLLVDGHKVLCKPHNIQWRSETDETGLYGLRNNRFGTSDRAVWSLAARVRPPCLSAPLNDLQMAN